ncbi:unnamed protein product [Lymnaea stagnalis]|uniref:CTCK domain-containing protein n=1 Tax=Lymnaea stagnalis TaxID=6523 RepID=A0AAV2HJT1_LYMST
MLVPKHRLTSVLVALCLANLLNIVTSAKTQVAGGRENPTPTAAKTPRKRAQSVDTMAAAGKARDRTNATALYGYGNSSALEPRGTNPDPGMKGIHLNPKTKGQDKRRPQFLSADIQVGCRELTARRYISDGFCTSDKPIIEVVCTGNCLPVKNLPWYAEFVKTVAKKKIKEWQCVEDLVQKKRVTLVCQDGSDKQYTIKVVKSCKCKKLVKKHNRTSVGHPNKRRRKQPKDSKISVT